MKKIFIKLILLFFILSFKLSSQEIFQEKEPFTRQDSLRGSITPEREWWDLNYYHLDISIDPEMKKIKGKNTIGYTVLQSYNVMQIDLQKPLSITSASLILSPVSYLIPKLSSQLNREYNFLPLIFYH